MGRQGGESLKRKNPGDAFRHQPGFSVIPREVPVGQVTSRINSGGYRILIPIRLPVGR